ncbi:MAG: class A beta-lactamase, subclass A2 [Bacteroidetes bacterium]|nr:class A beta-lactamase, subclass A2 [Bacteroidota bacterium]
MTKSLLFLLAFMLLKPAIQAQPTLLREHIKQILKNKDAKVGVGILCLEDGDTLTFNGSGHFPMQSVYKFHLALAVMDKVQKKELSLDQRIPINKSDLLPNTWSPIRELYPEANVSLPLREILNYTVSQSDNNGCDILFRLLGGPAYVNSFMEQAGIKGVSIRATEEEMHKDWDVQYTNWSTPWAAVQLLEKFYRKEILYPPLYDTLWQMMCRTTNGPGRIKGLLPDGTIVAHKTGSSGTNAEGFTAATNDIGIMSLPNGKHLAIAVFVSDSKENSKTNEKIIAEISLDVWKAFAGNK